MRHRPQKTQRLKSTMIEVPGHLIAFVVIGIEADTDDKEGDMIVVTNPKKQTPAFFAKLLRAAERKIRSQK